MAEPFAIAPERAESVADELASRFAATAVARDRAGGHAAAEREQLRASGLLGLSVPRAYGGSGANWATVYRTTRRIAAADSALAHLYGFHHLQVASIRLYGTEAQQARLLERLIEHRQFWGNALNPLDRRLVATGVDGGFRLDGTKSFASGSVGADALTLSAVYEPGGVVLTGVIAADAPGIRIHPDWDAFGQRQTDSGTVDFDGVFLRRDDVLIPPGRPQTPRITLRGLISQLHKVNLFIGIAHGAFEAAAAYSRDEAKPWPASGVARSVDDPYVLHRYGELRVAIRAAVAVADLAAVAIDAAFERGDALTASERGAAALAVAEAKVLAHRAALEVSNRLFDSTGARSTAARYGFDRFWRNARVHTLHDPIDYKLRDLGRHALTGEVPVPSPYA